MSDKIIKRIKVNNIERKPCHICNQYVYITQLHHLITYSESNKLLLKIRSNRKNEFEYYFNTLNEIMEGIWLCPNHHSIYHKLLSKQYIEVILMLSNNDREKYLKLFEYSKFIHERVISSLLSNNIENDIVRQIIKEKIRIEETLIMLQEVIGRHN